MTKEEIETICDVCSKTMDMTEASTCKACGRTFCADCGVIDVCTECAGNLDPEDDDED